MKKLLLSLTIAILSLVPAFSQTPQLSVQSITPDVILTNEETELVVTLINKGDAATESNTLVMLSSDSQYITILDDSASCPAIEAGSTQEITFVVKVNSMIDDNAILHFDIEMIYDGMQTVSDLSFDFEEGISGWTNIDADGDGFQWIESGKKLGPTYGHESDFCMFSQSYDNDFEILYPDNYLVTPEKYKIGKEASFDFWACAQDKYYPYEHFGVAVSTKGNTSADDFVTIKEWTLDSVAPTRIQGEWIKYSVDLSEYEEQEIWLAVRHFDCFDQYFMALDDVTLRNIYQPMRWNERLSVGVASPTPNIVFESFECEPITAGKTFDIDVTVINKGSAATTYDSKIELSTDDKFVSMIEAEAVIGALAFNETATTTFSFSTSEDMPEDHIISFNLNVSPTIVYDEGVSFTYTFEKSTDGWTSIDANNDGHTWYHTSDYDVHDIIPILSHSGSGHIMSESSCNALFPYSQLAPDDYIVSPTMIGVSKNTTIDLWAAVQDEDYIGEHFGIAVSMAGNKDAADFEMVEEWDLKVKARAGDWIKYSADLSKYEGMFVWVAIRHFKCENVFVINVDDVTINNFSRLHNWSSSFTTEQKVSIAEHYSNLNIYPNPVENELLVATELNVKEIAIYDIYGRQNLSQQVNKSTSQQVVDVANLKAGVYFVKIKTDKEVIIRQFIKQ